MSKTYIKNAASLLISKHVNRRDLDLSKEVLWVSVCQRAAKLPAVKVGGLKKILPNGPARVTGFEPGRSAEFFSYLQL